tara:strand:+ start:513 stop:1400 length:888 start_codon:yes stop_codon:yes gene_type:complete
MRAREFISEERLDEIGPAALALWGVAIAGAGVQAYETYRDIEDYRTGKIDKVELGRRIGTDAAIAVAGGIAGKALQKGWQFSKAGIDMIRNSAKAKKAAETAGKITSAKPGSVIRTDKGNFIAGVDGKATTVAAGSRGARKAKRDIKRLAAKQEKAAAAGAATATVAKKAPTGKAGAGTATVAKKAPTGKAGAGATKAVPKKSKLPVGKAAAGAAAIANSDQLRKQADYFKDLGKKKPVVDFNPDDIIYTGKEKNPPVKRLPGGTSTNIGLKPSKPSTSAGATALNKAAEYTKGN